MSIVNSRIADKPGYYGQLQLGLLSLARLPRTRVMEIGCGKGETLAYLKQQGTSYVVGVELVPEIAEATARRPEVDKVLSGNVETLDLQFPDMFDLIIASHVLEHLVDPWNTLRRLRTLLAPGGQLIGAIPNVRHARTALPLLFTGKWEYRDSGVLDWTHLRFFTRNTIVDLLETAGFRVEMLDPQFQIRARFANTATLGLFQNILADAYVFSATPKN